MKPIARLPPSTTYTVEQALLEAAADASNIQQVMILGRDTDGELFILSSRMDCGTALWLLKEAEDFTLKSGRGEHDPKRTG